MPNKDGKKLEKDIQREICDWLADNGYFFWRQNNTPIFDRKAGGFRAMPKYTPRGLPDIICLVSGLFVSMEVKVPGYWKYTDDQKAMKTKIEDNGGYYFLVTSIEEAKQAMGTFPSDKILAQ